MRNHGTYARRGLSALIAAGLTLGGGMAFAETVVEDNHTVTVTNATPDRTIYAAKAELSHADGDGTASASGNTLDVTTTDERFHLTGAHIDYQRYTGGTIPGTTRLTANWNRVTLTEGKTLHLYGAQIRIAMIQGGAASYAANHNTVVIGARGQRGQQRGGQGGMQGLKQEMAALHGRADCGSEKRRHRQQHERRAAQTPCV